MGNYRIGPPLWIVGHAIIAALIFVLVLYSSKHQHYRTDTLFLGNAFLSHWPWLLSGKLSIWRDQAPVAHTWNPCFCRGWGQDCSVKPVGKNCNNLSQTFLPKQKEYHIETKVHVQIWCPLSDLSRGLINCMAHSTDSNRICLLLLPLASWLTSRISDLTLIFM
jgi:hypothetical protein